MTPSTSIQLRELDVSTGGCLLAAAELESSKLYVPSKDKEGEWTILYCLPVGEEVVSTSIKLKEKLHDNAQIDELVYLCLLYTSPSPRDRQKSRMPSSA